MILEFEPISKIFLEIRHTIRAGDPRLARIDISKPDFLARDDLPPVVLLIWQDPPLFAIPLQQVSPHAAVVEEEIASSRLSLEEEIDKFRFKRKEERRKGLCSSQILKLSLTNFLQLILRK